MGFEQWLNEGVYRFGSLLGMSPAARTRLHATLPASDPEGPNGCCGGGRRSR
jgi:hypothetical protein